ncbi:MAG TPA: hypothetical protein VJS92_08390 [Candidatus Polarisedimenticolaceae bacterium]|nr:hypothetical protein [Candidatus Polarisedimenticolaceae bacterium]
MVRLADGRSLQGELYAAIQDKEHPEGSVLERLNEASESYLPLALADRHLLLARHAIVSVAVRAADVERAVPRHVFTVEMGLTDGQRLQGKLHSLADVRYQRTLDHLNEIGRRFVALHRDEDVVYVNGAYVVLVQEISRD